MIVVYRGQKIARRPITTLTPGKSYEVISYAMPHTHSRSGPWVKIRNDKGFTVAYALESFDVSEADKKTIEEGSR